MKYLPQIEKVISLFDAKGDNRYFVFGSSARGNVYHDIDVGVAGNNQNRLKLSELRERFYDAPIPYKVDVVDFDEADAEFRDYVFNREPLVWIR
jgi:predicted nucleotidyltransferase